jgi:hypothetical protein
MLARSTADQCAFTVRDLDHHPEKLVSLHFSVDSGVEAFSEHEGVSADFDQVPAVPCGDACHRNVLACSDGVRTGLRRSLFGPDAQPRCEQRLDKRFEAPGSAFSASLVMRSESGVFDIGIGENRVQKRPFPYRRYVLF